MREPAAFAIRDGVLYAPAWEWDSTHNTLLGHAVETWVSPRQAGFRFPHNRRGVWVHWAETTLGGRYDPDPFPPPVAPEPLRYCRALLVDTTRYASADEALVCYDYDRMDAANGADPDALLSLLADVAALPPDDA